MANAPYTKPSGLKLLLAVLELQSTLPSLDRSLLTYFLRLLAIYGLISLFSIAAFSSGWQLARLLISSIWNPAFSCGRNNRKSFPSFFG